MFKKVNPQQSFSDLEKKILSFWKENNILDRSIDQRPEDNNKTFYDGPITANGEPHTGHALTFANKDVIPRYWTMKGFKVERSLGWDCHGIPVEYELEKKLGFNEKKDIETFGIEKFNKLCRESVQEYKSNIIKLEEAMGRLTNEKEEYSTMDKNFIESVWWSLKELYEKGLLYEGFKVVPYSTRAGTTLSNAEVALGGYKPYIDPSVVVKFQLKNSLDTFVLAWTTTPWTIPSNLGLAINSKIEYVKVRVAKDGESEGVFENEFYILAKDCLENVFKGRYFEIVENISSSDLVGLEYNPPFNFFVGNKNAHKIFDADYVTTDSGTGVVHLAPYGAEDNEVFQKEDIQSFDVLDSQGDFTDEIQPYKGMFYRDANVKIIEDLKSIGRLFDYYDYEHEMPMCWRTKTPLIYKPINTWFVGVSQLRNELVENNNKINWIPQHAREGRFGNWLAEIKDWGISRTRYWGTPLPVWKSESGKIKFIGSFSELKDLSGVELDDPHRPYVDDVVFEFEGENYTRIPDVIDVWYDSGAMPFARLHYPFENKDLFEKKFPAQYISEGIDQTRGWFYTLHALAVSLFSGISYENVIIAGTITDDKGKKLSKSLGNYVSPFELIEDFGADTFRLNFFSTPLMYGEDSAVTPKTLKQAKQDFILPIWNIYSYFVTYSNIHNWSPREELANNKRIIENDEHPWDHIPFDEPDDELDLWVLVRLQETIKTVNTEMEQYMIQKAVNEIRVFIDDVSKWYIRNSRNRFVGGENSALSTLYYVLVELSKLLAPFAPFISDELYRELVFSELDNQKESVHLTDYPIVDEKFLENFKGITSEMDLVKKVVEAGHTLRVQNGLKVRQPLNTLYVDSLNESLPEVFDWMENLVRNELNVKEVTNKLMLKESQTVRVLDLEALKIKVGLDIEINEELKMEGMLREIVRNVQANRKSLGMNIDEEIVLLYSSNSFMDDLLSKYKTEFSQQVKARDLIRVDAFEGDDFFELNLEENLVRFGIRRVE